MGRVDCTEEECDDGTYDCDGCGGYGYWDEDTACSECLGEGYLECWACDNYGYLLCSCVKGEQVRESMFERRLVA